MAPDACLKAKPNALRAAWVLLCMIGVLAACRTSPVADPPPAAAQPAPPPASTRGAFLIEAGALDTWNAVGQIAVRTPGVTYEGRAQMLGLYALRYRGESFLVLTRAVPAAETTGRLTTRVTAGTQAGKPLDSDAVAELLSLLQRELPAEIESVRGRQAAQKQAAQKPAASGKRKRR